jgi:two-component system response regulator NreC
MTNQYRVILVDDHALFREGLRLVLRSVPQTEVVGEAASSRAAIELASQIEFDLAVVDVALPDGTGDSLTRELRRRAPSCKVLALSMVEDPFRVADVLRAGAAGYAMKSQPTEEILEAIQIVLRGERYLARPLAGHDLDAMASGGASGPLGQLSPREREVFHLLIRGWGNERIASALFIAARTVETHRQRIMTKLGVHSIVELLRLAVAHGLLEVDRA